jgi:CRP/FNR family nitrogen fixation transcriptional regulator
VSNLISGAGEPVDKAFETMKELLMSFSGQMVQAGQSQVQFSRAAAAAGKGGDTLSALDTLGTSCRFGRNETIFGEGDELQSSYKIVSGAVRLSRISEDGRRQIVEFRVPGDFIGFEWDGHYALTAEAVRDVVAVRYVRTRVDRMLEQRSDVRDSVVALIRKDLRAAHEHLITLGCQSAKERVATFLLQLARRAGANDGDMIEFELGRQDMADYLGLTLETVSRTLSEFKRIGAISLPARRQIVIRSKAKLRAQTISIN